MLENAWIIPLIPAASFFLILFFGKRMPFKGAELGILAVGLAFVLSLFASAAWIDKVENTESGAHGLSALAADLPIVAAATEPGEGVHAVVESFTWWQSGGVEFTVGVHIDGLATMMLFVVTLISLLVHVYSLSYMKGDRRFTYYYAALSLFTASMLTLVVAENTLQLLVGWELVGLCSFMLIGHWWEEHENSSAAIKAFLTTRTGDVGLLIGIIVLFFASGTFSIAGLNEYALSPDANHTLLLVGASCLLLGIIGKSGQFPLHTWLPDAMAGPTPVSALIHAATMVVAGVYLGARVYPVFWEGFSIANGGINLMAAIGGITILIGAALAFVQRDIKKVLAYSTISQLGYMVMALGVGAWVAAIFHLFTHAFFKALLFLGAGSVSHGATHHSFDMREMGGLRKYMPVTFWTFMIGSVALAGIFPFAGFWSKDEILATAGETGFELFLVIGLVGAVMTAAYMTRCVYLTFFGEYRGSHHPHESDKFITVPLVILAVFSVLAGLVNATAFGVHKFTEWVEPTVFHPDVVHPDFSPILAITSLGIVAAGIGAVAWLYFREEELGPFKGLTQRNALARGGYTFLENKYYLDHLYTDIIVGGTKGPIAQASYWINQNVIDGIVNAVGTGSAMVAQGLYKYVDQGSVDATYNGIASETGSLGGLLRRLQSGLVQRYAFGLFAGVVVLAVILLIVN